MRGVAWRARSPDVAGVRPVPVAMWCGCNAGCPRCTTRRGAARATRCRRVVHYRLCFVGVLYMAVLTVGVLQGSIWRHCGAPPLSWALWLLVGMRGWPDPTECTLAPLGRVGSIAPAGCGGNNGREAEAAIGLISRAACCSRDVGFSASNRGMIVIRLLHSRRCNPLAYNSCRLL